MSSLDNFIAFDEPEFVGEHICDQDRGMYYTFLDWWTAKPGHTDTKAVDQLVKEYDLPGNVAHSVVVDWRSQAK